MELEQLQDQLTELVCQLMLEQLKEVCIQAKVSTDKEKRHTLIRLINESVDQALEDEEDDVADTVVRELLATATRLTGTSPKPKDDGKDNEELRRLQEQYAEVQLNFQKSTKMLEEEMSRLKDKMNRTPRPLLEPPPPSPRALEVVIRCEFRINGQIGEPGQRDKLL